MPASSAGCDTPRAAGREFWGWPGAATVGGMSDVLSQVLPAASALAGGGLAFAGTLFVERRKFQRDRRVAQESRLLDVFSKVVESVTELGRVLRTVAEQIAQGRHGGGSSDVDRGALIKEINGLVGQVRRVGAMARLVGPTTAMPLMVEIEQELVPLQGILLDASVDLGIDPAALIESARRLLALRDRVVEQVRTIHQLPW